MKVKIYVNISDKFRNYSKYSMCLIRLKGSENCMLLRGLVVTVMGFQSEVPDLIPASDRVISSSSEFSFLLRI